VTRVANVLYTLTKLSDGSALCVNDGSVAELQLTLIVGRVCSVSRRHPSSSTCCCPSCLAVRRPCKRAEPLSLDTAV